MTSVAAADLVVSGMTRKGTDDAVVYATLLARTVTTRVGCGIAIANCTSRSLVEPNSHVHAGRIVSRPIEIKPNFTGLIAAEKSFLSAWGSTGIVSYAIEGTNLCLQILYDVPTYSALFSAQAIVFVGKRRASKDLFTDMYYHQCYGQMTLAKDTARLIEGLEGYDVKFIMEEGCHVPLTVYISDREETE